MGAVTTFTHRAAYEVATASSRWPGFALRAARLSGVGVPVSHDTDIVIEGYPRSANTAAFGAFGGAQPGHVRIAHHTHTPANVIAAVRRGLPVIVLIRSPDGAVPEMALIRPELTVRQAMRGYRRFYRPLLHYRDRIVVVRSEDVLDDVGRIVQRVNDRFGTNFIAPQMIDGGSSGAETGGRYWEERHGGLPVLGRAEPIADRDAARERIEAAYLSRDAVPLRADLLSLYERFVRG
jgi:hypothetical protein